MVSFQPSFLLLLIFSKHRCASKIRYGVPWILFFLSILSHLLSLSILMPLNIIFMIKFLKLIFPSRWFFLNFGFVYVVDDSLYPLGCLIGISNLIYVKLDSSYLFSHQINFTHNLPQPGNCNSTFRNLSTEILVSSFISFLSCLPHIICLVDTLFKMYSESFNVFHLHINHYYLFTCDKAL